MFTWVDRSRVLENTVNFMPFRLLGLTDLLSHSMILKTPLEGFRREFSTAGSGLRERENRPMCNKSVHQRLSSCDQATRSNSGSESRENPSGTLQFQKAMTLQQQNLRFLESAELAISLNPRGRKHGFL